MRLIGFYVISIVSLVVGALVIGMQGFHPPAWLIDIELVVLAGIALICGFHGYIPKNRPLQGTLCVLLGLISVFIPPQLLMAAFLIGFGTRLLWQSALDVGRRAPGGTVLMTQNGKDVATWKS